MATRPWLEEADCALLKQQGQTSSGAGAVVLSGSGRVAAIAPLGTP